MATLKASVGSRMIPTAENLPEQEKSAAKLSSLARLVVVMPWSHAGQKRSAWLCAYSIV